MIRTLKEWTFHTFECVYKENVDLSLFKGKLRQGKISYAFLDSPGRRGGKACTRSSSINPELLVIPRALWTSIFSTCNYFSKTSLNKLAHVSPIRDRSMPSWLCGNILWEWKLCAFERPRVLSSAARSTYHSTSNLSWRYWGF